MLQINLILSLNIIVIFLNFTCCAVININNDDEIAHLSFVDKKWGNGGNKLLLDNYNNQRQGRELLNNEVDSDWYEVEDNETVAGRTFGAIRRLKLAIPAIMYKLGVVTTLLGFLTLFTIKGVVIGVIILIIQLSAALSKLHQLKKDHGHDHGWESDPWQSKTPQNIHVHVHGSGHQSGHYSYSPPPVSSHHSSSIWDRDRSDLQVGQSLSPSNSNLNLYASLTPYSAYNNYKSNSQMLLNNKLDDDLLYKLREYKELKELRELRDSLYQLVV